MRTVRSDSPIPKQDLATLAADRFGDFVKAVVDIRLECMIVGGEMHADEEETLIEAGSNQSDLWGINLYPEVAGDDWIEFDSMINLRPTFGNRTRGVDDLSTQVQIRNVVSKLVQ